MLQGETFCRVTTHDLRADDTFHLASALIEVIRFFAGGDFRSPMDRDKIPCRKVAIRCDMELAGLSKTRQHRRGGPFV
jgi:hypothetical protein